MTTLTFDQIHEIVAAHQRAEAERNTPIATARRAVFTLSSLVGELSAAEAAEILDLIDAEFWSPIAAREA